MLVRWNIKRLRRILSRQRSSFRPAIVVGCVLVSAPAVQAGVLDLTWNAPTTNANGARLTDLDHYRVYVGTSSSSCPGPTFQRVASPTPAPAVGEVVATRVMGLVTGTTYVARVTAVDMSGNESLCSNQVAGVAKADTTPPPAGSSTAASSGGSASGGTTDPGDGGGGGCLIATAAYGSPQEPQVVLLRKVRDQHLMTTRAGKAMVEWYYQVSPPVAARLQKSPAMKSLVRGILWPLVGLAWLILHPGISILALVSGFGIAVWLWLRPRAAPFPPPPPRVFP